MDINKLKIDKFLCGEGCSPAQNALRLMLKDENIGTSYADMMRCRLDNLVADQCKDIYYVAYEGDRAYSRLWNGWGRHAGAIGNFGNFVTVQELRGQGLGHRMLEFWFDDIKGRQGLPLCFLCMGDKRAAKLYFPYGFQTIEKGATYGPLFMPLGNTPTDFREFCEEYYRPSPILLRRPASVEWRHEIDCLLKYALWSRGLDHTINGIYLEQALLYFPDRADLLFTESGRCVGWGLDGITRMHPVYQNSKIENG